MMRRIGDWLATLCGGVGTMALALALLLSPDARVAAFITEDPPPDGGGGPPLCLGEGSTCLAAATADGCSFSGTCSPYFPGTIGCTCGGTARFVNRVLICTPSCGT